MSGKFVVNIEVRRELYENLPAITVCLPQIISLERLGNFNQKYYQDYLDYNEMLSQENILNFTKYNENKQNLTNIYWKVHELFGHYSKYKNFFEVIIDNISLPYDEELIFVIIEGNLLGK